MIYHALRFPCIHRIFTTFFLFLLAIPDFTTGYTNFHRPTSDEEMTIYTRKANNIVMKEKI